MELLALVLFVTAASLVVRGQDCPALTVPFMSEGQLSNLNGCTSYQGNLFIGSIDCSSQCTVSSLSSLDTLTTITGSLSISCCPQLLTLSGLPSLESVSSIDIYYNPNLTTITGLQRLQSLRGHLRISQNPQLASITGFALMMSIAHYLEISANPSLSNIRGLAFLSSIAGGDLTSGHALTIAGTALVDLGGLAQLSTISYGTVRIEDNQQLCYAGWPQWEAGLLVSRTGSPTEDKGIDWRGRLSAINPWQYTVGVAGGGVPTLLIRNNAPSCGTALFCHDGCLENAGCLSPNSMMSCGSCTTPTGLNTCDLSAPPSTSSVDIGLVVGVVVGVIAIVLLVPLIGLAIWGCVVVAKRYNTLRQGSFDISVTAVEDGGYSQRRSRASQQIATVAEPTTSGSNVTRQAVKYKPKLDKVVGLSSYKQSTEFDDATPVTTATRREEKPRRVSRPKSDSDALPTGRSLSESSMGQEPSTEDILQRLREEQAEVPMDFPWENIKKGKEFGSGDFGKVFHAEARKLLPGQRKTAVIVKQLKEGATPEERESFLRPVEAMKVLQHPNVLSLLGVSNKPPSLCVILEYCGQGNFKTFLVRKRRESAALRQSTQLITMSCDMAAGLEYLHSMDIAHNDFAARSCLVTGDGKVKLGDYGITRQTFKEDYYSRKPSQKGLPIRWMAPELIVVQGRNNLSSLPVSMPGNIWSFGVALWEVCSFAQWPYDDLTNEEVLQTLKTTGRCILENPLEDSDKIAPLFDLSVSCWVPADKRPSMTQLHSQLKDLASGRGITPHRRATNPVSPRRTGAGLDPLPRPKSQSLSPRSQETANDDTLKRAGYKPKRPAPTKPAPRAPPTRGNLGSQEEPLVISNSGRTNKEPKTKAKAKPAGIKSSANERAKPAGPKSTGAANERGKREPQLTASGKPHSAAGKPKVSRQQEIAKPQRKPQEGRRSELPLPQEMDEAMQDDHAMAEDDFILEPPQKFSQSSLDDLTPPRPRLHFQDVSDEDDGSRGYRGNKRRISNIEQKINTKKKVLNRQETPAIGIANPSWESDDDDFDNGSDDFDNASDDFDNASDDFDNGSDEFDERGAMEEDDLPSVVYDEDIAALIW